MRIIEPIAGMPRITIRLRPTHDYGKPIGIAVVRQQSHPLLARRGAGAPHHRRAALLYRERGAVRPDAAGALVFGHRRAVRGRLATTCRDFCDRTRDYWREWVRRLSISYEWQDAIIRAAITLKLSQFRGDRRHRRRADHLDSRSARIRAATGTIAIAGCATPISW